MHMIQELFSLHFNDMAYTFRTADAVHQVAYIGGGLGAVVCLLLSLLCFLNGQPLFGLVMLLCAPVVVIIGALLAYILLILVGAVVFFAVAAFIVAALT